MSVKRIRRRPKRPYKVIMEDLEDGTIRFRLLDVNGSTYAVENLHVDHPKIPIRRLQVLNSLLLDLAQRLFELQDEVEELKSLIDKLLKKLAMR